MTSSSSTTTTTNPLPPLRRLITSHTTSPSSPTPHATIASDTSFPTTALPHGISSTIIFSSPSSPAPLINPTTSSNQPFSFPLESTPFVNQGSIFRVVDLPPATKGALHRSISLDYIIVQRGNGVVLTLDLGHEQRFHEQRLDEGDIVVQQATMHAWSNVSDDEWARLLCVMLPAVPPRDAMGMEVEEDLSRLF